MKTGRPKQTFYFFSERPRRVSRQSGWRPNMDIYETDEEVVVILEIPGVKKDEVEVVQHEDRILIRGVRYPQIAEKPRQFHQIEIVCGSFEKEIILPHALRGVPVEASLSLGMLTVRLAKAELHERSRANRIRIEAEADE